MTVRQMLLFQVNEVQGFLGDSINLAAAVRGGFASSADANQTLVADIDQLVRLLAEIQISFADLTILLNNEPKELVGKIPADNFNFVSTNLEKIIEHLSKNLPKREVPVLKRGNSLAIALFKLQNLVWAAKMFFDEEKSSFSASEKTALKDIGKFLETIENFFFTAGRWINLLVNQKEYLWIEPKKPGEAQTTAPAQGQAQTIQTPKPTGTPTPPTVGQTNR